MDNAILTAAGIKHRRNRFPSPSGGTFATWSDDIATDGPDGQPPRIFTHNVTIELYESHPDPEAEEKIEAELSAQGLHWTKQDRYWIQAEKMYQVVYEYSYIETRRA